MPQISSPAYAAAWQSPVGWFGLRAFGGRLERVTLSLERPAVSGRGDRVIDDALRALQDYFAGRPMEGIPPLAPAGTEFQRRVWRRLQQIGAGETLTYGQVAAELGTHPRAVGGACRANPILILVPCHRVVAGTGQGGFAGHAEGTWPAIKHWLLEHETPRAA